MLVECVSSVEGLERIIPEWNLLWGRSRTTPFQTPDWLLPWWKRLGGGELFSFSARERGELVGLAPLFLHEWQGHRQITLLGNGVSDCLDFILHPDYERETADAILRAIGARADRWDVCDLQDLPAESELCRLRLPAGLSGTAQPFCVCMSTPLPADVSEFRRRLSAKFKGKLRRSGRHLSEVGAVVIETAQAVEFRAAFQALIELHRERWAAKRDPGMIQGDRMAEFHTEAALRLCARGLARLHTLKLDGVIRAVLYLFFDRGRTYYYLGGFDPALARFSPGAVLLDSAIENAILEGAREFDFLRGTEDYKTDWRAEERTTYRLCIRHGSRQSDAALENETIQV